jgi:hypothetical protein
MRRNLTVPSARKREQDRTYWLNRPVVFPPTGLLIFPLMGFTE